MRIAGKRAAVSVRSPKADWAGISKDMEMNSPRRTSKKRRYNAPLERAAPVITLPCFAMLELGQKTKLP
ncbi:MAG: hypothetical protein QW587_08920 [Candidatus Bathyarchaeia archaeon]